MNRYVKNLAAITVGLVCVCICMAVVAQDPGQSGQPPRPPLRKYIVAVPRASLTLVPSIDLNETSVCCTTVGAACNFARQEGRILMPVGSGIVFVLGQNTEGIWYEDACGALATQIKVEVYDDATGEWTTVGRDGALADRCGPSIGWAPVGVPAPLPEAREYHFRIKVWTLALPATEGVVPPDLPPCSDVAFDVVSVLVRAIEGEPTPDDLAWRQLPPIVRPEWRDVMPRQILELAEPTP